MEDIIEKENNQLIENIKGQISEIDRMIGWTKSNMEERRAAEVFKQLVDKRRTLRRYQSALSSNPAIAAFGESQKGKSYVISSLLASKGQQFMVSDNDGKTFNFIEEMNPPTNETEATGVVTRFTNSYKSPDAEYPIKVKLLSLADILQILCNTAYLDVKSHIVISREDINEEMAALERKYAGAPEVQSWLIEDDVLTVREHVERYMSNVASELLNSDFFDVLTKIIRKMAPKDWPSLMARLWYDNASITMLFTRLLEGYQAAGYAEEIFIPVSALLNTHTTLMSSMCLQNLGNSNPVIGNPDLNDGTDILCGEEGGWHVVRGFNKSILSALTAEIVFQIPDDSIEEELSFCVDGVTDENEKAYLLSHGWNRSVNKRFLRSVDILDFPGARSRLEIDESQIPQELATQMVLRGKVAYLFNKYSDEKRINVLMVCHDHMQNGSSAMPPILRKWVEDNIGKTPRDRELFIDKSIISPLFLIATKFNIDLRVDVSATKNELLDNRWDDRFSKVLYNQVLMATSNKWFDNWTPSGSFRNTYLLRDYKYSGTHGNRLFEGFAETGSEIKENDPEFRKRLRESFSTNANVRTFFDDTVMAWNSACTQNNDGTVLIIQKLGVVAGNAKESRLYKNRSDIQRIHNEVTALMSEFFHNDDEGDALQRAIIRGGGIIAELDVACGRDNYAFGRVVKSLQITENYVFDTYYSGLNSTSMIEERDMKEYDLILRRCMGEISPSNSFDRNLDILTRHYHFSTPEECRSFFENVKGLSLYLLFEGDRQKKTNSRQLAEKIVDKWLDDLQTPRKLKFYETLGLNALVMLDLIENMRAIAKSTDLVQLIAASISPSVDAITVPHAILDMIADTTAEIINSFVLDFGYSGYDALKLAELRAINDDKHLGLSFAYDVNRAMPADLEAFSAMFDAMRPTEENSSLTNLPSFTNYNIWTEMLLISFIASHDIPTYDVEANRKLGEILERFTELKVFID